MNAVTGFEWDPYLNPSGSAASNPDAMSGLNDAFRERLQLLFEHAPPEIRGQLQILSAYRSPEHQARLWDEALVKYGSAEAARKWVAPPGQSQHNHGFAADLTYLDDAAREYVRANASRYGLGLPMAHEPWHIEMLGARDGGGGSPEMPPPPMAMDMALAPAPRQEVLPPMQAPAAPVAMAEPYVPPAPIEPVWDTTGAREWAKNHLARSFQTAPGLPRIKLPQLGQTRVNNV